MSIYIILVLLFVLVLVLVIVILLHVDSLVLVIVSKIPLSIAILFYALVYDDDDEDESRRIHRRWNEFKSGRHMSGAKRRKKFFVVPSTFFGFTSTISRFGKRFRVVSTV